jgi:hypothetical protein
MMVLKIFLKQLGQILTRPQNFKKATDIRASQWPIRHKFDIEKLVAMVPAPMLHP